MLAAGGISSPMTGAPGISPAISSPPEVCASARSSRSSSLSPPGSVCGMTQSRLRPAPARHVPGRRGGPGPVDQRHRRVVHHRRHAARPGQLEQVAQQPEAGHVGGAADAGVQRRPAGPGVERGHHVDRLREDLAGGLVPGVEHPAADRLGQADRHPGPAGVDAQQRVRVGQPGHRHAVLGLRIVDAVPARQQAARVPGRVQPAAQHLAGQLEGQRGPRPAQQVQGDQRRAPDRVHVRERVRAGDPAERVGVVHHRAEEVGGGHHRPSVADLDDRRIVTVLHPDEQVGVDPLHRGLARGHRGGQHLGHHLLQLTRRDLAGAAAAGRVLGQPEICGDGHGWHSNRRSSCGWRGDMVAFGESGPPGPPAEVSGDQVP